MDDLKHLIRDVPGFPLPEIVFRDVTPLLRDANGLRRATDALAVRFSGQRVDAVAGIESRGFIFGAPLAAALGVGFIPVRKPGKLPSACVRREYALEYGTSCLEMHRDALTPGERVLLIDDLLATGGTARAAAELIEDLGGVVVGAGFVIELTFLLGRAALGSYDVHSLLRY